MIKLQVSKRLADKKSQLKQLRGRGDIPAVLYSARQAPLPLAIDGFAFQRQRQEVANAHLATTLCAFELSGIEKRALIKEIQYCPTSYAVLHLDLQEVYDDLSIRTHVPIRCSGRVNCVGLKLGGVLRQLLRAAAVECLPRDLPSEFVLDISELGLLAVKRVADLAVPAGVAVLEQSAAVVATIAKS